MATIHRSTARLAQAAALIVIAAALAAPLAADQAADAATTYAEAQAAYSQARWLVQGGAAQLVSDTGKDVANRVGERFGVGYYLKGRSLLKSLRSQASVDLDYIRNTKASNVVDALGLTYVERVQFGGTLGNFVPYWGFGLGLQRGHVHAISTGEPTAQVGEGDGGIVVVRSRRRISATRTGVGGKALLGANLGPNLFTELTYTVGGSAGGVSTDDVALALGCRF